MTRVLYITYDGVLEPLGQSQVLGYLEKLTSDHDISLLSFEKKKDRKDKTRMAEMRARLSKRGIDWTPLAYHKSPSAPATAYDISAGIAVALAIVLRKRIKIVHARSYVPALIALAVKRATGAKFLFDMRGFWADERVDGGLWSMDGRLYRATKAMERRFLLAADHVVTLTHTSLHEITSFDYLAGRAPPIDVIPTCADLACFRPLAVDPNRPFTFGYVGSVGTWYLFDETLELFKAVQRLRPDARLLVVNRNDHAIVQAAAARSGIPAARLELTAAEHREVPQLIARMHVGAAIIKPSYSKMASAPTKLAEYLGCGVPCAGNINVGDVKEILEDHGVGVALTGFSPPEIATAAAQLITLAEDPITADRCTRAAQELFSLESGIEAYRRIYERLAPPIRGMEGSETGKKFVQ